mmetsp:Transcript_6228/g.12687  ORF Transcript_6228/g.12687 Transcript_6228/m.12687 type:complete len:266 (+) Transcript_6228:153-950(+)
MASYSALPAKKKRLVAQLQTFCVADRQTAVDALEAANWDIEVAGYLVLSGSVGSHGQGREASQTQSSVPKVDAAVVSAWFEKYAEADQPDSMQVDGIVDFCSDLGVGPEDVLLVVISKHFAAANMLIYTKEEFLRGMESIGAESIDALKAKIPELRAELEDEDSFKEIYAFAFSWACPPGQKSMQTETAVALWNLLLPGRFELLKEWNDYIEKHRKHAISKDEWQLLLQFAKTTDKDLNGYDENEAWPVLIDEFAEFVKTGGKSA